MRPADLLPEKNRIRSACMEARRALSPSVKAQRDSVICRTLCAAASFRYADTVLLYAPLSHEINIDPVAEAALACGKQICYPRCETRDRTMRFHYVSDLSELTPGAYRIPEPPESNPVFDPSAARSAVCIVPALAYGRDGHRIGYGQGYYDRYLRTFCGARIGVVYRDALFETLPHGKYDLTVHAVITEKGVYCARAK